MLSALAVALAVLGIALLIRNFVDQTVEFKNAFFIIIAIFILVYVGAAIFVTGRVGAWMDDLKSNNQPSQESGWEIDIFDETFEEVDLSTPP